MYEICIKFFKRDYDIRLEFLSVSLLKEIIKNELLYKGKYFYHHFIFSSLKITNYN